MIPALTLSFLPGMRRLVAAHRAAGQQPDNLCGPYWISILLRAFTDITTTPSEVGLQAKSILPLGDPVNWIPAGACPRQDYRVPLPQTERLDLAGTSVLGLIHAVQHLSGDRYCLIPLQTNWTARQVLRLLALCRDYGDWQAIPVGNWQTGALWGSTLPLIDAIAYLDGDRITPPPPDWQVGHFAVLAGQVVGSAQSLVLVQDTYPLFGWDGYHFQSPEAIAQALNRDTDPHQGGILLFAASDRRAVIERVMKTQGFRIAPWDNGTPWPLDV
jgi:hypothetical protein